MNEEIKPLFVEELTKIFSEKLAATGSMQEAFVKAVWVSFNRGIQIGREESAKINKDISK